MAGWTCPNNELVEWDGTIKAKSYRGDGSQLTGIAPGGGSSSASLVADIGALSGAFVHASGALYASGAQIVVDFKHLSGAYVAHAATANIHFLESAISHGRILNSGAYSHAILEASGAAAASALSHLSGAYWTGNYPSSAALVSNISALSGAFVHASGALYASAATIFSYVNALSGAFTVASSALWASAAQTAACCNRLSGAFVHASGALYASGAQIAAGFMHASGALYNLSGAYYAHAADISDPHGVTLSQTRLSGGTIVTTGVISGAVIQVTNDWSTMSSAYVANVVYGTGATGPTASTFPIGTLYIKYTP